MGGQSPSYLHSIERMALYEERDQNGNVKPREWELIIIPELTQRVNPLMVPLKDSRIMILGGSMKSDGVIIDSESRQVEKVINTGGLGFTCSGN